MRIKASFFGPIRRPWPETTREIDVPAGVQVEHLLEEFGYVPEDMRRVAVVVNGKRRNLSFVLSEDDDVRFVLLAGGG
jgi:sulfur carrier protein ThiS